MGSESIILVPGILALWMCFRYSAEKAFLNVYLPVLLLLPDYYRMPIDGFPDPNFSQAAILPIGLFLAWRAVQGRWSFSLLDFVVWGFCLWCVISDFHDEGFSDAQNMLFDIGTLALLPYMAGKALLEPAGLRVLACRRIVWLLVSVCLISVYEFRLGKSLFRPTLQPFFAGGVYGDSGWYTQVRWGFARVAGPFGHAILMGSIVTTAYLLYRWLAHTRQWDRCLRWMPPLPFAKWKLLGWVLLAGLLMTLSRGPWLAAAAGLICAAIGTARNPKRGARRAAVILVLGGVILYQAGKTYVSTEDDAPEEQSSATYRKILIDEYTGIALQHGVWGWGRTNWPKVPGMKSVDNWYLLLALMHGVTGSILFLAMNGIAAARLVARGFRSDSSNPGERAFLFTMLGILVSILISVATVFLGAQLYPLLFVFLGWSEACAIAKPLVARSSPALLTPAGSFRFARVIA